MRISSLLMDQAGEQGGGGESAKAGPLGHGLLDWFANFAACESLRPEVVSSVARNCAEHASHGIQHQPHRLGLIRATLAEFAGNHSLGKGQLSFVTRLPQALRRADRSI